MFTMELPRYIWKGFTPEFRLNCTFYWQARLQYPSGACRQFRSGSEPAKALPLFFLVESTYDLQMGQEGQNVVFWT